MLFLITGYSIGQSLENENFEEWENNSAFEEPEGWVTRNDLYPEFGIPQTVIKSTDAAEGNYAVKMETFSYVIDATTYLIPSYMVYGQDINAGVPYTWNKRLKKISFYYKYIPNGVDTGAFVLLMAYKDKNSGRYITHGGVSMLIVNPQTTYKKFELPVYYSSDHKCDTMVFYFANSINRNNGNKSKVGTVLMIDDIDTEWEDFPAVLNTELLEYDLSVYPNPVENILNIRSSAGTLKTYMIVSFLGSKVMEFSGDEKFANVSLLPAGIYYLQGCNSIGKVVYKTKFIKKQ